MPVKVRPVHTGKLGLAPYGQPAAPAHPGPVDHNGVHAHYRLDPIFLGQKADEFHHRQRSDGNHLVILVAGQYQLFQRLGHQPFLAVAAVVGHHAQLIAYCTKLLFQNHQITAPESDHRVYLGTLPMQLFRQRVCDGAAYPAAYHRDFMQPFGLAGFPQRSHQVLNIFTLPHRIQLHRPGSYDLIDDGHRSLFTVVVRYRQRNPLAFLFCAYDHKLSRLRFLRDHRRF